MFDHLRSAIPTFRANEIFQILTVQQLMPNGEETFDVTLTKSAE